MHTESANTHHKRFSATLWLKIVIGSLLAALSSATLLYIQLSARPSMVAPAEDNISSFVAPRGTLDSTASFTLVEQFEDSPPPPTPALPEPVAPPGLLDPARKFTFDGEQH